MSYVIAIVAVFEISFHEIDDKVKILQASDLLFRVTALHVISEHIKVHLLSILENKSQI
jgi:hypothetical protein